MSAKSPIPDPYETELPWGGRGWAVDLDFISRGLKTYGSTRKEVLEHAVRDFKQWKRGGWK